MIISDKTKHTILGFIQPIILIPLVHGVIKMFAICVYILFIVEAVQAEYEDRGVKEAVARLLMRDTIYDMLYGIIGVVCGMVFIYILGGLA